MKPKTQLLLYQMLWGADKFLQPTLRNLDESFESWTYRNGFQWQIARLEASGCIEVDRTAFNESKVCRLTEAGRMAALGGRDPEQAWGLEWDRKWRMFLFDIPERRRSLRRQLTRALAAMGCGCLQGSVWISATEPCGGVDLGEDGDDCSHLLVLEAGSQGLEVDRRMAASAWDFDQINELYEAHRLVMSHLPDAGLGPAVLADWSRDENRAWLKAVRSDPLLPAVLLPKGYLGRRNWRERKSLLKKAGRVAARVMRSGGS